MVFRGATQVRTVDGRRALMVEELRASASRLSWTAFVSCGLLRLVFRGPFS